MPIVWKCVLWTLAWVMLLHLGFQFIPIASSWLKAVQMTVAIGLSAFLFAASYFPVYRSWRREQAAKVKGKFVAKSDGRDHSLEDIRIQFADVDTYLTYKSPSKITVGAVDRIWLKREGGEIKVSLTIHDSSDNLIVDIRDNKWEVSPLKSSCWDKNYTSDSLEVKDGRGRVVLQLRLLPDRVQLQAEWNEKSGVSSLISAAHYDQRDGIVPRFKYPSEDHWGEPDPDSGYQN